ncbi:hypothetical protein LCGC14_0136960 [marine sediment metagenome]|uniref:Uncharacterized protein n=2 Tax=root TaxID=1 RepID=A0A7V1FLL2_9RHOB|nr:hypothetical protein [Sulfitobacter litoralis]HDY94316.1 hypothetical protein [Sulfitobacter litoralis]HDZ50344.1 hypothetical protein [Sulfitobacter litoralis]
MAKTINTHDAIIATGEELEAANPAAAIEPWEVYKALGSRGKFDRVRDIWTAHQASRVVGPAVESEELPSDVTAALSAGLAILDSTIQKLFSGYVQGLTSDHVRQMQLAQNQHLVELNKLKSQLEYWMETALEAQEQVESMSVVPKPRAAPKTKPKQTTRARNANARKPVAKKVDPKSTEDPILRPGEETDGMPASV